MSVKRALVAAVTLVSMAGFALSGCSQETSASHHEAADTPSDAASALVADHNEADVAFATGMIPHHAQALTMVEMAEGKQQSPAFAQLLRDIEAAQAPEIEQMTSWLEAWGEPVPDASSHADHGDMHAGDGMEGMLSGEEMMALEATPDAEFEDAWIRAMIKHHEGAVGMAEAQLANGQHPEAMALAQAIQESQSAEIAHMREMLAS